MEQIRAFDQNEFLQKLWNNYNPGPVVWIGCGFLKLGMIAEKTGCAIVLIEHLNKSSGTQSTYRGLGSIDIIAAVRSLIFIDTLSASVCKENGNESEMVHCRALWIILIFLFRHLKVQD